MLFRSAWNLVKIDGQYYYIDVTWGDAFYEFEATEIDQQMHPTINYDYFCVTTEQIKQTHNIDEIVKLPFCTSMNANYYVRENSYFFQYEEEQIKALFETAYDRNKNYITLKCSQKEVYQKTIEELITNQKVFRFINNNSTSIAYTYNEEQLTISFWLN